MERFEGKGPFSILVDPVVWAIMRATMDNQGRDWRRIKRQVRKATKKARNAAA